MIAHQDVRKILHGRSAQRHGNLQPFTAFKKCLETQLSQHSTVPHCLASPTELLGHACAASGPGVGRYAKGGPTANTAAAVQQRQHVGLQAPLVPAMVDTRVWVSSRSCSGTHITQQPTVHRAGCCPNSRLVGAVLISGSHGVQAIRSKTES